MQKDQNLVNPHQAKNSTARLTPNTAAAYRTAPQRQRAAHYKHQHHSVKHHAAHCSERRSAQPPGAGIMRRPVIAHGSRIAAHAGRLGH